MGGTWGAPVSNGGARAPPCPPAVMPMDTKSRNSDGNVLFDFLNNSTSLSLLTPQDLPTRFDPVTGRTSTLDLFIGSNKYISNCTITSSPSILGSLQVTTNPPFLDIGEQPDWNPIRFRGKWKTDGDLWPAWQNRAKKTTLSTYQLCQ